MLQLIADFSKANKSIVKQWIDETIVQIKVHQRKFFLEFALTGKAGNTHKTSTILPILSRCVYNDKSLCVEYVVTLVELLLQEIFALLAVLPNETKGEVKKDFKK